MAKKRAPKREQEYKKDALPEKTTANRVDMWRRRIEDATKHLMIPERMNWAHEADMFLSGGKEVPAKGGAGKTHRVYINYSLPLHEELHRSSIPSMPNPVVEARTKASFASERVTQQFLNYQFDKLADIIIDVIDSGQWDDSKMGAAVFRADWNLQSVEADPTSDISQENIDVQTARATAENMGRDAVGNPADPVIATSDLDIIHLQLHEQFLPSMDPASAAYAEMGQHIQEHRARLTEVVEEGVRFERVAGHKYIYDDSAGWEKRGWECEIKSVRVKFLIENGYKNVNPRNAPPEDASSTIAYEDKTVRIGEIHDRLNRKEYVIPMDGQGVEFLMERPWRYGNLDIYKLVKFHPYSPDQSWGMASMQSMIPILIELAKVDYYAQRHVANHPTPKVLVPKGPGSSNIKKGLKDTSQMIIEVTQEQAAGINIFNPPALPVANDKWRNDLINGLRRVIGLDAQDTGQANPHAVSATESYARSQAGVGRIEDRQKVIVSVLSWLAKMILSLYKNYADKAVEVKINAGRGPEWALIEPRDLPLDVDVSFNIEAVTDKARAENITRVDRVNTFLRTSQIPIDQDRLNVWTLRELGVKRPEQFRIAGEPGPENVEGVSGSPGIEGSSEAPVGTQQNQDANARFGGGADALAEAQQIA